MFKTSLSQWTAAAAVALILVVVAAADDSTDSSRHHNILNTLPRHTSYKAVHKLEGHKATLKCQLYEGFVWSKCVWRHKQNSAVISREPNGHSYQVNSRYLPEKEVNKFPSSLHILVVSGAPKQINVPLKNYMVGP